VRADQLLTGKKLLIKNPPAGPTTNKLVHLGKDASITREVGLSELSLAGRGPCDLSPLDGMDDAARE
jgi:hypothetical protein